MASLAPTRINIFGLGGDRAVFWKYKAPTNDKVWTGWTRNGGKWRDGPVSISRVQDEISVFCVGADDGVLYQSNFDLVNAGDLSPWKSLGGKPIGPPCVTLRFSGILHIFYVDADRSIHHRMWDGAAYSPKEGAFDRLPGDYSHVPAAASAAPNEVSVFAIDAQENRLHHYRWTVESGWGPVEVLPGHWAGNPKAVSAHRGHLDVFGCDVHGSLNHASCKNRKDWTLTTIAGAFTGVEAISCVPEKIDLFALGVEKVIYHRVMDNGLWFQWRNLMGMMSYTPKAVSHMPGGLALIGVGTNTIVYCKFRDPNTGSWTEWIDIQGAIIAPVW